MKRWIVAAVLLAAAAVVGLQVFLAVGLTDTLRRYVLPQARERCALDLALRRSSVNLAGGSLTLYGVHAANPPGFDPAGLADIPRFKLKVGPLALLRGRVGAIRQIAVRGGVLRLERDRYGRWNTAAIFQALGLAPAQSGGASAAVGAQAPVDAGRTPRGLATFVVDRLDLDTRIDLADHTLDTPPFRLRVELHGRLVQLASHGRTDALDGAVNLLGAIVAGGRRSAFDIKGRVGPLGDPARLSCDLTASIQPVDLAAIRPLVDGLGLRSGTVGGTITLQCREGVFVAGRSVLRLAFREAAFGSGDNDRFAGLPLPDTFSLTIPITGTVTDPQVDIPAALVKTLASKDAFDQILEGVLRAKGQGRGQTPDTSRQTPDDRGRTRPGGQAPTASPAR